MSHDWAVTPQVADEGACPRCGKDSCPGCDAWPVMSLPEFLSMSLPAREVLLARDGAPVLRKRDQVLLYAPRGVGKTWTTLGLAWALSHGHPLGPWQPSRRVKCLIVDGEMPGVDLQARLRRLAGSEPIQAGLCLLVADACDDPVPSLSSAVGQALIERKLTETGAEVLLLDHLSALFGALAENDAEAWAPCAGWLLSLRRRGYTVVLVHHAGRKGQQRGSSKREDTADLIVALRVPDGHLPEDGMRVEVALEKARGLTGAAVEPFELRLAGNVGDASVTFTHGDLDGDVRAKGEEMLREGKPPKAVAKELAVHLATVYRWRKAGRFA